MGNISAVLPTLIVSQSFDSSPEHHQQPQRHYPRENVAHNRKVPYYALEYWFHVEKELENDAALMDLLKMYRLSRYFAGANQTWKQFWIHSKGRPASLIICKLW